MQPSRVCTASAWVLGEPHAPGRSRGSQARSCSGKALASGWEPQPERAQRGGAAGTATPPSRERQLGQVSGRSRRAGVLRPCPQAPPPEGRPPRSTREFAALTRWYPAGGVGTARVLLHPALSPQAQPERSKGLGHRSHAGPWHAIHAAPPPQRDLDHHSRVRKQSELAASLSRPTAPEPPGLRHHLISVRVGAGAARRVLHPGAGSAGDLLQPGPGSGPPREGSAALVPA